MRAFILDIQQGFRFFISIQCLIFGFATFGQMQKQENLFYRFLKIDSENNPSLALELNSEKTVGFYITANDLYDILVINSESNFSVWIFGKLIINKTTRISFSKQTLEQYMDSGEVYVSVYAPKNLEGFSAVLTTYSDSILISQPDQSRIFTSNIVSINVVLLLWVLTILGFVRKFSSFELSGSFSIGRYRMRPSKNTGTSILSDLITFETFAIATILGFIYLLFKQFHELYYLPFQRIFYLWIYYSFFVFLTLALKYLILWVSAVLFNIRQIVKTQFGDFIRFFFVISLIAFLFYQILYWLGYGMLKSLPVGWEYYFLVMYMSFLFYYFFKMVSISSFRKLHIITYLCTTELIGAYLLSLILFR
jgi:hypothetical protein